MKTFNISDVKQSPTSIFKEAAENDAAVYVSDDDAVAGVMMTHPQYESMNAEIESLYDQIDELIVKQRLAAPERGRIPVNEVIGMNIDDIEFDENDGWE